MPVIIGLYIIFPVLVIILRKWGPVKLLLISVLITYTALIIAAIAGATGNHANDLFLFWTVQFAMGIILAYIRVKNAEMLRLLLSFRAFIIGSVLFFVSWILRTYILYGKVFNDFVTSIGIFLILLNIGWGFRRIIPKSNAFFIVLSKQSYFMYLVHYPVMKFLLGPIFTNPIHPLIVIILGGIYILVIYFLCSLLSPPITTISSKLFANYYNANRN
jgi:peptidoglycan/LPS O-acetylase OafA/YrhL